MQHFRGQVDDAQLCVMEEDGRSVCGITSLCSPGMESQIEEDVARSSADLRIRKSQVSSPLVQEHSLRCDHP